MLFPLSRSTASHQGHYGDISTFQQKMEQNALYGHFQLHESVIYKPLVYSFLQQIQIELSLCIQRYHMFQLLKQCSINLHIPTN